MHSGPIERRRNNRRRLGLGQRGVAGLLLSVVAAACGGTAPPQSDPASANGAEGEPTITFSPDQERVARGTVTFSDGGSLSATGADGTVFTLDVPPFAVAEDTELVMTPLLDVEGFPEQPAAAHAVQLAPEGLTFYEPVRLTIEPAEPIPADAQLAFESAGDGSDLSLALIDPEAEELVILLDHFSTGGLGQFTPEQRQAMRRLSSRNAEERLGREFRDAIQEERRRQLTTGEDSGVNPADLLESQEVEFQREVLGPLRANAEESCFAFKDYVSKVVQWERYRELAGLERRPESIIEALDFIQSRYEACEAEAIRECREAKDASILIDFYRRFAASLDIQLGPPTERVVAEARRRCEPQGFRLEFSGDGFSMRTPQVGTDNTVSVDGFAQACPDEEGALVFDGEIQLDYERNLTDQSGELRDESPGQTPDAFALRYPDADATVRFTDALGDPEGEFSFVNGLGETVGPFELEVESVEPEC